ncbi:MAG: hypothetical protein JSW26_05355 [Desulfobacterales bacterium]|nr:MAG: hypothetical protein JSW26_05355 [Desulfobacterales bacterium]
MAIGFGEDYPGERTLVPEDGNSRFVSGLITPKNPEGVNVDDPATRSSVLSDGLVNVTPFIVVPAIFVPEKKSKSNVISGVPVAALKPSRSFWNVTAAAKAIWGRTQKIAKKLQMMIASTDF